MNTLFWSKWTNNLPYSLQRDYLSAKLCMYLKIFTGMEVFMQTEKKLISSARQCFSSVKTEYMTLSDKRRGHSVISMNVILDEVMNNISSHHISRLFEVILHLSMRKSNTAPSGNTFLKGSNFVHVESLILQSPQEKILPTSKQTVLHAKYGNSYPALLHIKNIHFIKVMQWNTLEGLCLLILEIDFYVLLRKSVFSANTRNMVKLPGC